MAVENNIDYYKVEFASGAAANTFTSAIQFNGKYEHVFVRRQTMASVATIYPQVALTNASSSFFRVLTPSDSQVIASAVSSVRTIDTSASGYFIDLGGLAQFPYLRFEVASLPTDSVNIDVFAAKREYS